MITSRLTAGSTWTPSDRSNFARKFGSVSVDHAVFRDPSFDDGGDGRSSYSRKHSSDSSRDPLPTYNRQDSFTKKEVKQQKKKQLQEDAEREPHCIDLSQLTAFDSHQDSFKPIAAVSFPVPSSMSSSAKSNLSLANIGFLAASVGSHLMVINMRGPEVMLFDNGLTKVKKHKGLHGDGTEITALNWCMSSLTEGELVVRCFKCNTLQCLPRLVIQMRRKRLG